MPRRSHPDAMSHADAAMRLRYVTGMRTGTRRAGLLPSPSIFAAMGALVGTRGVLIAIWPHRLIGTVGWLVGVLVPRPFLLRHWRGVGRDGLLAATRLWLPCVAAGLLGALLAVSIGVDPLVTSIAATPAARALLAGMRAVALATVATAALAGAVQLHGGSPATGEILLGVVLIASGVRCRAAGRSDA